MNSRYGAVLAIPLIAAAAFAATQDTSLSNIRVRILHTTKTIRVNASGPYNFMPLSGGKVYAVKSAMTVSRKGRSLSINGKKFTGDVLFSPQQPSDVLAVNGRRYRGVLIFEPIAGGRIDVVNQLSMDQYLYGVLPREVGGDWALEALKAQAVVSRTYVMANLATDPAQRYDVYNDVYSQVYGGLEDEAPMANRAVDETRGEFLVDNEGKPVEAFFHSSCGGYTETPENVWRNHPASDAFMTIRDDYCKADPYNHWTLHLSASTIRTRLRRSGINLVGSIDRIKIAGKTPSGRAAFFAVHTNRGTATIPGNKFRMALGPESLRSTLLLSLKQSGHDYYFEGRGWGHGVGLCQWGAKGRAEVGQTYDQILKAYYPRARLVRH